MRVWRRSRIVCCTTAAAVHVATRVARALSDEGAAAGECSGEQEAAANSFDFVVLDEAAAMLEVCDYALCDCGLCATVGFVS